MKRYNLIDATGKMLHNPIHNDGEWVLWEDHEAEVQKLIDAGMEENIKTEAWKKKARQQLFRKIIDKYGIDVDDVIDEVLK